MKETLKEGYEWVKRWHGEREAKEILAEYHYYEADWRKLAPSGHYNKFERVALPLLQWSYLYTVNFAEILSRLHSVSELRWDYRTLTIKVADGEMEEALLLAGNAGGNKVERKGDLITVTWLD